MITRWPEQPLEPPEPIEGILDYLARMYSTKPGMKPVRRPTNEIMIMIMQSGRVQRGTIKNTNTTRACGGGG